MGSGYTGSPCRAASHHRPLSLHTDGRLVRMKDTSYAVYQPQDCIHDISSLEEVPVKGFQALVHMLAIQPRPSKIVKYIILRQGLPHFFGYSLSAIFPINPYQCFTYAKVFSTPFSLQTLIHTASPTFNHDYLSCYYLLSLCCIYIALSSFHPFPYKSLSLLHLCHFFFPPLDLSQMPLNPHHHRL